MMDSDGYFRFVGRADDVIISAGFVHCHSSESNNLPGEISCLGVVIKGFFASSSTVLGHLKWRVH